MLRKYMMVLFGMGLLILSIITSGCMQSDDTANIGMAVEFNDHAACAYIANDKGWYDEEGINLTTYESYATGMRLEAGMAWRVVIAAEMVAIPTGIGALMIQSESLLRVDTIIVCLMVLSVMCLVFERSFGYIETRMTEQWR